MEVLAPKSKVGHVLKFAIQSNTLFHITVDPHLSEHCGTEASLDMPNVRLCEITIFNGEFRNVLLNAH